MTSPIALRRTIKICCPCCAFGNSIPASPCSLSSADSDSVSITDSISRKTNSFLRHAILNDLGRGMILRVTDNYHPAAAFLDHIALGNSLRRVVRAFGVNVRPDFSDQRADIGFIENDDRINIRQRRKDFCSLLCRHDRTPGPLQRTHARIAIHCHNHAAPQSFGRMEIPHVPDMQQVKTSVRQNDFFAGAPPLRHTLPQPWAAENLGIGIISQCVTAGEDFSSACKSSCWVTVAVPLFITTIPPAQFANRAACSVSAPAAIAAVNVAITVSPAPVTSATSSDP